MLKIKLLPEMSSNLIFEPDFPFLYLSSRRRFGCGNQCDDATFDGHGRHLKKKRRLKRLRLSTRKLRGPGCPKMVDLWRKDGDEKAFLDKIKKAEITFSLAEVIAFAPLAQKVFSKPLSDDDVIKFRVNALKARKRPGPRLRLISHTGHDMDFDGVCTDVEVDIGGLCTVHHIFVVAHADHQLVLGQPFLTDVSINYDYRNDEVYVDQVKMATRFLCHPGSGRSHLDPT